MFTLSTKNLRIKMPFVRKELKKGTSFLLIHKSQPIAQIKPVHSTEIITDEFDKEVEAAAIADMGDADDDFLSQGEVSYYLSLK